MGEELCPTDYSEYGFQKISEEDLKIIESLGRKTPYYCGALFDAVWNDDKAKVQELLFLDNKDTPDDDPDGEKKRYRTWYVNEKTWNDWRPLHAAAEKGLTSMASLLIDSGADLNVLTNTDYTPLHLACTGGFAETAKLLIDRGAKVNTFSSAGFRGTPLHFAAGNGHLECAKHLLKHSDSKVNQQSDDCCTPLHYAVQGEHLEMIKLLLANGAKEGIDLEDWNGFTALHSAVQKGSMDIVVCLVEDGGARLDVVNGYGQTAAMLAKTFNFNIFNYLNGKNN